MVYKLYIRKAFFLLFCRALEFFCAFISLVVSEYRNGSLDNSLLTVVYLAYDQSLKHHHNWLMRGTFYVRSQVCMRMFTSLNCLVFWISVAPRIVDLLLLLLKAHWWILLGAKFLYGHWSTQLNRELVHVIIIYYHKWTLSLYEFFWLVSGTVR